MSLKIIGENKCLNEQIARILIHYFNQNTTDANTDNKQTENSIFINTKYFTCKVPIQFIQSEENIVGQENSKTDMIIFAFDQNEQVTGIRQKIDTYIKNLSPQASIICVNSQIQSADNDWIYQNEVGECQNFVSVIYQNFYKIGKTLPKWESNSLLKQDDDDVQIFSLFDLIQTNSWTNTVKKTQVKNNKTQTNNKINTKQKQQKQENEQKQRVNPERIKQNQNVEKQINVSTAKQQQDNYVDNEKQTKEQNGQEMDEQEMEKQMMEFQRLMEQMMAVKSMPMSNNDRKNKAEELIIKLARSMGE